MKRRVSTASPAGSYGHPVLIADPQAAELAHVFRRTGFGPFPGQVEAAASMGDAGGSATASLIEDRLASSPLPFDPPGDIDHVFDHAAEAVTRPERLVTWWLDRMRSDGAGLHEKMMWFWHTHFTTSIDKAEPLLAWRQLRTFHHHALGSFADLLRAILTDGAMLRYLDGDGSVANAPNENLSRELLELFTLGRGNYGQSDVVAGARALAGWRVDWETSRVTLDRDHEWSATLEYLGHRGHLGIDEVVDAILAHEACAPFIVGKLWRFLVGTPPATTVVATLAGSFRGSGWQIAPLVGDILRSEQFAAARLTRPRSPVEWFCAVSRIGEVDEYTAWDLERFGQVPYHPPNVAGWPDDRQWLTSAQALARVGYVASFDTPAPDEFGGRSDLVEWVLARCGLFEVSDQTRGALDDLARVVTDDDWERGFLVLRAALVSPEFAAC